MNYTRFHFGFERKLGYSFLGLLAGNLVCLAISSTGALLSKVPAIAGLLPASWNFKISQALGLAVAFGIVSVVAWVVIGLPVLLSLSANLAAQLHWSLATITGAVLGAGSFVLLVTSLSCWREMARELKDPQALQMDLLFLAVAIIIGGTAFSVYCMLVRQARHEQRKNGAPSGTPQYVR